MDFREVAMTYRFFRRFFGKTAAAWMTALWFALLLFMMFALSGFGESPFAYLNF
jgi:hypothetical protein